MRHLLTVIAFYLITQPALAEIRVFACEPEWAALIEELAGDQANTYTATTAMQDVHHIQARPSLIARLRRADLLICAGAELESGWLPVLLRQAGNARVLPGQPGHFEAAMAVERLEIPTQLDRSQGDVHAGGSPHVHLDPHRVAAIAKALTERLKQVDPDNAAHYQQRAQDFDERWQKAIQTWEQQALPLKGLPVVTHHKAWVYLFDWLGMKEIATLEPKPGLPASAAHLAQLKQQLITQPATMVIRAAYQNDRASQWLNQHTGTPLVMLPYTVGGTEQAKDLFGLFDDTLDRLLAVSPPVSQTRETQ
jgi:zinc/manganese transport system substrate-binding protein